MPKKILITGATGLIGRAVSRRLIERGDEVIVLTRNIENARKLLPGASEYVMWDKDSIENIKLMGRTDVVIHLAGENIGAKRWSKSQKKKIKNSRIMASRLLIEMISRSENKPEVFVSASAVGYYGNRVDPVNESSQSGEGFLPEVVREAEDEIHNAAKLGLREVIIRIGIVLDKNGGALEKMIMPYKFFAGGTLGSGRQWMPWIHIDDIVNIFLLAVDNENLKGIYNGVSPNPVSMKEFAASLGKALNRPSFFRVPALILKIIMGESAALVLEGAQVYPVRIVEAGYKFTFENLNDSLNNIFKA